MSSTIDVQQASCLSPDITFELIPDCPAATSAGYTAETRAQAQLWYPPVVSGAYFYYAAWAGSILSPVHLSSILVCRRISTGELVYARDCTEYKLDTSANYLGDKSIICRPQLFILDDSIYLCNATVTNIGPQVFCVDLKTGDLRWAAAYYPPEGAPSDYVTTKGDYSYLVGRNNRISDLSPTGGYFSDRQGNRHKLIFLGSSSFQNAINYNIVTGGFPVYTDQGQCVCIEDHGNSSSLYWITSTCAPPLQLGDVLQKGGPAHLDPFRPDQDKVVILSVSSVANNFLQPYFIQSQGGSPDPTTPIIANVLFDKNTVIDVNLVQKIWSTVPNIYVDSDRVNSFTLNQLITNWKQEQQDMPAGSVKKYMIWAYVSPAVISLATSQGGNTKISYFKFLNNGQTLEHLADVAGLGYWGNSTWGAPPTILEDQNLVIFESGQGHDIPWDESLYYSQPSLNFVQQKKIMLDVVDRFISGNASLANVDVAKKSFVETNKLESLDVFPKSPRGRMSYSDAIIACNIVEKRVGSRRVKAGEISFALRSVPWDNYSFLTDNPQLSVYPVPALDADASSGVHVNGSLLTITTKGGIGLVVDIAGLDESVKFDNLNLEAKGVTVPRVVYNGPNAALGGANYLADIRGNIMVSLQANTSWFSGCTSTSGILERQVSEDGKVIPINSSFVQAFDVTTGQILWETPIHNRSVGEVRISGDVVYTEDAEGNLYCLDIHTGNMIWKYNGKQSGLMGGITCPVFHKNSVIWTNNYNAFGLGGASGPNGVIFKPDLKILITRRDSPASFLDGRAFGSWDSSPKYTPNPAVNPVQKIFVSQEWVLEYVKPNCKCSKCEILVCLTKVTIDGVSTTYRLIVDGYDFQTRTLYFKDRDCQGTTLKDARVTFFNKNAYSFEYTDCVTQENVIAWLEPVLL